MARRVTLSTVLLVGAGTLVAAIVAGNAMGNRVLGQIGHPSVALTPIGIPTPGTTPVASQTWKHVTLAAIATDPGFPDPRITPPPPPPPPPPTPVALSTPHPKTTREPARGIAPTPIATFDYTSPPLPLPLSTDTPAPATAPASVATPDLDAPVPGVSSRPTPRLTPNAVGP